MSRDAIPASELPEGAGLIKAYGLVLRLRRRRVVREGDDLVVR